MRYNAGWRLQMIRARVGPWARDVLKEVELDDRIDQKKVRSFKRAVKKLRDSSQILEDEISEKRPSWLG